MSDYEDYSYLRQPPNSIEAEQAVIGAVLQRNHLLHEVEIAEDDFYHTAHRVMWSRMQAMAITGTPVDPVTLSNALGASGELDQAGGVEYVADVVEGSRGGHNLKAYADIIKGKALLRKIIRIGGEIADSGYTAEDVQQAIDHAQTAVMDIESSGSDDPISVGQSMVKAVEELDAIWKNKGDVYGLPSGLADLDRLTGGFRGGQMVVVAGRPGMGKTTLAMNIAENAALSDNLTIVFSLEMTHSNLSMRMMSSIGRFSSDQMKRDSGNGAFEAASAAVTKMKDKPLYIDDCFGLTSAQIMSRSRKIAQRMDMPVGLIVVDYMQLLGDKEGKNGNSNSRITEISRNIKKTAVAMNCPIIAVSQLNRSCEARPNKRPLMSDLRESGAIEQDADIVIMAYRDEVYDENSQRKGIAELILRKQRDGPLGTAYVASRLEMCRFDNLAPEAIRQLHQSNDAQMKVNGARYEEFT